MSELYFCKNKRRRDAVDVHQTLNGIDYLEVLDRKAPKNTPRQVNLLVRCLKAVPPPSGLYVSIEGGVRITPVEVRWYYPASYFSPDSVNDLVPPNFLVTKKERQFFSNLDEPDHVLVVRAETPGDFSNYRLSLRADKDSSAPPQDFDAPLSEVEFSFKVECPSEFDCGAKPVCPPPSLLPLKIDYLAKDYASFRRLMLDRLGVLMPQWRERNPADLQILLTELLAYVGDRLSYYQDSVATEAYLGTARKRVSLRRHARLVDYHMHDGCNARAWICFEVEAGGNADGVTIPQGTALLTGCPQQSTVIRSSDADKIIESLNPEVFETMTGIKLRSSRNRIEFHTWSDQECCLPRNATKATLKNDPDLELEKGDLLFFEEIKSPVTGRSEDSDPAHRHAVRLTVVEPKKDPLDDSEVVDIQWHKQDALPFPFCISAVRDVEGSIVPIENVSIARGNVVLSDHGRKTSENFTADQMRDQGSTPLRLSRIPVTQSDDYDANESAFSAFRRKIHECLPDIRMIEDPGGDAVEWNVRKDLLSSDKFSLEFVMESEADGTAYLRFGDGISGKEPYSGSEFEAVFRFGNGKEGNVGAEIISHIVLPDGSGVTEIKNIRNPLPAQGGTDPESLEEVREFAPQAFRTQQRAVTEKDYEEKAMLYDGVQKAVATFHWTGSWYTVFLVIDREEGKTVEDDALFRNGLFRHMEKYRVAGFDLEIEDPDFVPLDISISVCVKPDYFKSDVKQTLLKVFSCYDPAPDQRGFFHPDNFTFAQPVYLSRIYEVAAGVEGVASLEVLRFQRWGKKANQEIENGFLTPGRVEIVRLDNDPNFPENGKIEFDMRGGI